ncbi:hypothetical protein [Desulfitobacterium sp.]|uniref:hypothetical protein n=1 Tax=Desulfitobacterium sp. TaxID=49981 RepID=UPI002B5C24B3|nr:hypothetical protein [Desulfitobacterium sp.]HVJ50002.1 hypothetical protein [Desulfitobacterium sp.]
MNRLLGNLRVDFRRAFFSFGFLLAVVGMSAALFFSASTEGQAIVYDNGGDVLYLYRVAHLQGFSMLSIIFATLPYAISFCTDWNNQFIRSAVIRTNIKSYGISKVFTTALAGGSAVALGEVLFILLLRLHFPLVDRQSPFFQNAASDQVYGSLLSGGDFTAYFASKILISFFAAAFFAVLALWISTYLTNVFVTLASPILSYYFLLIFTRRIGLPQWCDLQRVLYGTFSAGKPVFSLLYSIFFLTFLCTLMGIMIVRQIKRRLEHG